jgi:hypothetical protein
MILGTNMFDHFALPILVQANQELSELQLVVDNLVSIEGMLDSRSFVWGKNSYSSARFYKFLFEAIRSNSGLTTIWKSKCDMHWLWGRGFFKIKGMPVPDFKLIKPHTEQSFTTLAQIIPNNKPPHTSAVKPPWLNHR